MYITKLKYEQPYLPNYGLNSTPTVLLERWIGIELPQKVVMPLNKQTNQTKLKRKLIRH